MGDVGDDYRAWDEIKKEKKLSNKEKSIEILNINAIEYVFKSQDHIRAGNFDYWPSTGLFIHIKTKKRGRGIFNLISAIDAEMNPSEPQELKQAAGNGDITSPGDDKG